MNVERFLQITEGETVKDKLEEVRFDLYVLRTTHPLNADEVIMRCELRIEQIIEMKFGGEFERTSSDSLDSDNGCEERND